MLRVFYFVTSGTWLYLWVCCVSVVRVRAGREARRCGPRPFWRILPADAGGRSRDISFEWHHVPMACVRSRCNWQLFFGTTCLRRGVGFPKPAGTRWSWQTGPLVDRVSRAVGGRWWRRPAPWRLTNEYRIPSALQLSSLNPCSPQLISAPRHVSTPRNSALNHSAPSISSNHALSFCSHFSDKKCAGAEGEELVLSWQPSKREPVHSLFRFLTMI